MYINTRSYEYNADDFEPIPEVESSMMACAINVAPSGIITLNERFKAELRKHTKSFNLGFELNQKDKRVMRLFVTDTPNYSFQKNGSRRDPMLTKHLVESGIALPARYVAQWVDAANACIAVLNDEVRPSSLSDTLKRAQRKRLPQ